MRLFSPAKVNLFLGVLGKRHDGYREVVSLMQTVSLGDILHVERAPSDVLTCSVSTIPLGNGNLICQATALFRKKTGEALFLKIHLDKNIPVEAGLGGGSSNAATALYAMNSLSRNPVSLSTLQRWSAEIGSDIPFFFSSGTALCTGRGEIVEPLSPLPLEPLSIVKDPRIGLSTAAVYKCLPKEPLPLPDWRSELSRGQISYFNHLEAGAFALSPAVMALKERLLSKGFERVMMTGSGAAFLCWGKGTLPEGLECYAVSPIYRPSGEWFTIGKWSPGVGLAENGLEASDASRSAKLSLGAKTKAILKADGLPNPCMEGLYPRDHLPL